MITELERNEFRGSFLGLKRPGVAVNQSLSFSAGYKNVWI